MAHGVWRRERAGSDLGSKSGTLVTLPAGDRVVLTSAFTELADSAVVGVGAARFRVVLRAV